MPSWQARLAAAYVRATIRRADWGQGMALARRARGVFGAPAFFSRQLLWGLDRTTGGDRLRGEWLSAKNPSAATILYIHGGGYVSGSPMTHRPVTTALARLTRCRVFSLDYRVAPEARFPAALDDVCAAYRVLSDGGATRIALAGESAGGGLVLALAMHVRDAGLPAPACVVAMSPWTDLKGTGASIHANNGRCAMFRPENIEAFASVYLDGAPAHDPRASPLFGQWHGLPPTLLQVGSTELLLDDARRVHDAIVAAGGRSRLSIYDDVVHGWQLLAPFVPESRTALREASEFIRSHTVV
jgi:monoterpene epsilon-lactone hydrolase